MAILALAMMVLYSPLMTAIVVTELLLYGLLRWAFYQPLRDASQERLLLAAKESSHFLETLRAMTALKLFGQEAERRAHWVNLTQDVINRDVATQKLGILFKTGSGAIATAQGLAIFYVGAGLVMDSKLTLGMLLAFSSYSSTFSGRVVNMIDQFTNFKMLTLHIERLSDIVLERPEEDTMFETDVSRIQSAITLKDVRFRYADGEPWVLDKVNLHIPAGQSVALVGPSGCGKTTLCKIILGLIEPTEGEVLIDNIPVKKLGFRTYRDLVGTVMQDDSLLAGSIQDNITFFKDKADIESVFECARMAAIHEEICAMPMGYQTLVGDMGSSLSGGQKQRILLARALYKKPKVLALDEATSHLDVNNESRVSHALSRLRLTRILVAHRPETINSAERVVALVDGKAVEVRGVDQKELEYAA
jgi:ATP-binding cassette subfamily B protein RaxB